MRLLTLALAALVAATHLGYFWFDDQATAFYVLRGIEGAALFGLLAAIVRPHWPAFVVCLSGALEEAQTAACGWLDVAPTKWAGMCVVAVGPWPYAIVAATAVVWLVSRRTKKNDRQA